ncbi:hypothetical protein PTSG_00200 [Salpingoeca rosetta]|uniref:Uncharacterized protein n=1 Tax=Salpingoeca rosetta (strain ATCC 50818 / BSB-021) TaxID=946362 RepID=F2TVT1_SALR5|nr:uncharacterized protein PTSG_00200 [Salpingoeca rosetta]EGD72177.1 hypothetical protein PTSG_00200 [Salpingoeca rosetta]|eukprot:XP_004998749.1 hypothetical protein PTSG_00200 [Salpingoeca rosetta]
MATRIHRPDGAKQSNFPTTSRVPKPHKDMRGVTAIRKSEAALRVERDELLEKTAAQGKSISDLQQQLAKATQTAQEATEQVVSQREELEHINAENIRTLQEQHNHEEILRRLQTLQALVEAQHINSVTGQPLANAEAMAQRQQETQAKACADMEAVATTAQTCDSQLQALLAHTQALEQQFGIAPQPTATANDDGMSAFAVDLSDPAQLRDAHMF